MHQPTNSTLNTQIPRSSYLYVFTKCRTSCLLWPPLVLFFSLPAVRVRVTAIFVVRLLQLPLVAHSIPFHKRVSSLLHRDLRIPVPSGRLCPTNQNLVSPTMSCSRRCPVRFCVSHLIFPCNSNSLCFGETGIAFYVCCSCL